MWLACVSDLSVFAGGLLAHRSPADPAAAGAVVRRAVETILEHTGTPDDSGPLFAESAAAVRSRLGRFEWHVLPDDETAFTESPEALVRHAPIIAELMALDEEIVRNSVRFPVAGGPPGVASGRSTRTRCSDAPPLHDETSRVATSATGQIG